MGMITQVILPLGLAFIMFSMGLSLTTNDFKRVAKFPKAFILGTILQLITLPLIAFALAKIWVGQFDLLPSFAAGLMILAASPGGVTSNLMTALGRGDVALSVSLTSILSLVTVFTIPFIVNFSLHHFGVSASAKELPILNTIIGIFILTTIPVLIGLFINSIKPKFAQKIEPKTRAISTIIFIFIVIAAIAKDWNLMITGFNKVGLLTLSLNLTTMIFAYYVAKFIRLNEGQARALVFECGLQNGTMAIFISLTLLGNEEMMLPSGIYSILMFLTGGLYILYLRRKAV